tara:strand:- start:73 stop:468 length:396 start_codon:yes stop_codon:yes gene_type:complete
MANRFTVPNLANAAGQGGPKKKKEKKPRRDLSRRGRELAKRKGKGSTWVSSSGHIIQKREGSSEKVGEHISHNRSKSGGEPSWLQKAGNTVKRLASEATGGRYQPNRKAVSIPTKKRKPGMSGKRGIQRYR